jgi:hypothetical protein
MSSESIALQLGGDLLAAVDNLAKATGLDRMELIARTLRRELLYDGRREFIYVLMDTGDCVRYVGRARDPRKRLGEHIVAAKAGGTSAKERWLAGMLAAGTFPRAVVIDDAPSGEAICDRESYWIEHFRSAGKLTNGPASAVVKAPSARRTRAITRRDVIVSAMEEGTRKALADLSAETAEWQRWRDRELALRPVRDAAILRALDRGVPHRKLAAQVGVTTGRIGQIRDALLPAEELAS